LRPRSRSAASIGGLTFKRPRIWLPKTPATHRADWQGFERIAVDTEVNRWVDVVDSNHLASALRLRELMEDQVVFACADVALVIATKQESLLTSP
jgi:hypothetical protein